MAITPGPWTMEYDNYGNGGFAAWYDIDSADAHIAKVHMADASDKQGEANARAIAALPLLVEALQAIDGSGCCQTPGCNTDMPKCDAMIARTALEAAGIGGEQI